MLEAEHITCVNSAGNAVVDDVTFKVHSGEIVGIYGLMGAGRTELFECMLGTERNYRANCGSTANLCRSGWQRRIVSAWG